MNIIKRIPWKFIGWVYSDRDKIPWKIAKKIYSAMKKCMTPFNYISKYDLIEKEHIKHFGRDFPEKTFYVIRISPGAGLLSDFHGVVNHTYYAISKGYIPIVNMESYWNFRSEKKPIEIEGKITSNSWEYFFEQPCGYSVKDIKKAKNVILGDMRNQLINKNYDDNIASHPHFYEDKNAISRYYEFVSQYCRMNHNTMQYIFKTKEILFNGKNNVLGISYRVAGLKNAKSHSIGASMDEMIKKVSEIFYKENFNYIFLSTDEQEIVDEIYKVFPGEKIINPIRRRFKTDNHEEYVKEYTELYFKKESIFEYELNYLTEIYLLSQCDGIVASSQCNGLIFAIGFNNNKYRHSYIFNLGVYS